MYERDCPKCGYGIMEKVIKIGITGGWDPEENDGKLQTTQKQTNWWRCIDCLYEMPMEGDNGNSNGG